MQLRPYQTKAILSLGEIFYSGKKRAVLYSPTGSGKTLIALEIIRRAIAMAKRIIFLCNRIELVNQTSRRISRDGISHGIIQGSNTRMTYEPVQVCSIQSIDKRGYPEADIVVIDEAHGTASSKAYHRLMEHYKGKIIVGLTATPFAKGMSKEHTWGKLWEDITSAATIRELIDEGFLVDCDIYSPSEPDLSKVKIVAGDYNETQLGEAVDKEKLIGDIVVHWTKLAENKPTVCFATNIAHSKHIVEQFNAIGVSAEHIDCYTDDEERSNILSRVTSGKTKIISNVGILQEGWDFPACEVLILARPTRSLIRYIQMAGRILRPIEGKSKATILDHSGTCRRLGFPTDDLPLVLDDGKPRDKKEIAKEEKKKSESLPVLCPKCSALLSRKNIKCPRCGHELPKQKNTVETADGELVKMSKKKGKLVETPVADRNKIYAELRGYAQSKGFKDGWAWYKCKELYGSVPRERPNAVYPSEETLRLIKYLNIKNANRNNRNGKTDNTQTAEAHQPNVL